MKLIRVLETEISLNDVLEDSLKKLLNSKELGYESRFKLVDNRTGDRYRLKLSIEPLKEELPEDSNIGNTIFINKE